MVEEIELLISDETLRDGQQQPWVTFTSDEMKKIAQEIMKLDDGSNKTSPIYNIDIMPTMHHTHKLVAEELCDQKIPITLAVPMSKPLINYANQITPNIITISSLSDALMKGKNLTREKNISSTQKILSYAKKRSNHIGLAGEDSSRTDMGFLIDYVNSVKENMDYFIYCDTDGRAEPFTTYQRIKRLSRLTDVPIFMHCHNDTNQAVENTLQGILGGAKGISSTFTGIGDRAGNAATEKILKSLKDDYGTIVKGLDYDQIPKVTGLVRQYAKNGPAEPGSKNSKTHEAGIHVDALLKANQTRESVYSHNPDDPINICLGVSSGKSALQAICQNSGLSLPQDVNGVLDYFKDECIKHKKSFSEPEVISYLNNQQYHKL